MSHWLVVMKRGRVADLAENSCAIVGDCDIAVRRDENLVQAAGTLLLG